jgi:hypothetical protein
MQPVNGAVYVMSEVPAETAVTIPDEEPMPALAVVPLTHVPPAGVLFSVPVEPAQSADVPVNAAGKGFTDTIAVDTQLVGNA